MDDERIKKLVQQALDSLQDDNELFQETMARIRANPVMAARLDHYNDICSNEDNVPMDEVFQVENTYWGEVFLPTQNQVMLEVIKAMQATIEEWVRGE